MDSIDNKTIVCLRILPNGIIEPFKITFDLAEETIAQKNGHLINIMKNMGYQYDCKYYITNIAKAMFPSESYYSAYYEDNNKKSGKRFNAIGTHLINNLYNNSNTKKNSADRKCYGNCYILHYDSDFDLHDIGVETFVNMYNKIHTLKGIEERHYTNRIFKKKNSLKYCLYEKYTTTHGCNVCIIA